MKKSEFEQIVKSHFKKYGFSKEVLGGIIENLEPTDLGEVEFADVTEICNRFEPIAGAFQSETDARVARAVQKAKSNTTGDDEAPYERSNDERGDDKREDEVEMSAFEKRMLDEVLSLKREVNGRNNSQFIQDELKAIGMNEIEVESALFGRSFESKEDANEFIEKQAEFKQKLDKERTKEIAGDGFDAKGSTGNFTKGQKKTQFDSFVKAKEIQLKNELKN